MSFGFGFSISDFLAVLKLVDTVIDAVREGYHVSSSFRVLINELYALETALLRVKRLLSDLNEVEKTALQQVTSQCQRTIGEFYENVIRKNQPHLQQGGTNSRFKDAWVAVKWTVCRKEDLEVFRAEIRGHTSSIGILLLTMPMEATTTSSRNQDLQNKSIAGKMQEFSCQVMSMLNTITDGIAQSVQQGKQLIEASAQIVNANLRIFQSLHEIHSSILRIPSQVQRQQPICLIDPFNMETPFHLEFVRSSEALLAVLKVNLKESGCGPAMIDRGQFVIEELGTQTSIDLSGPWETCFYPGQRVAMSMIFKQPNQTKSSNSSCPRCGKYHEESTSMHIICTACGGVFRHIQKLVENTQGASLPSSELDAEDIPKSFDTGPLGSPRKRKRGHEDEDRDALTNIHKFRRIQLISTSTTFGVASKRNRWVDFDLDMMISA